MSISSQLDVQTDDDRVFFSMAGRLIDAIDGEHDPDYLVVVRVRNWFDHKWLRFSGKGRVPFQGLWLDHPGVSLDAFVQDRLTFPPFTPRRIVRETHFTRDGAKDLDSVHRLRLASSAWNLHRRVADFSRSLVAVWLSTASEQTGRASVMTYLSQDETVAAWYASFARNAGEWKLQRVKGTPRERIVTWLGVPPPPASGIVALREPEG